MLRYFLLFLLLSITNIYAEEAYPIQITEIKDTSKTFTLSSNKNIKWYYYIGKLNPKEFTKTLIENKQLPKEWKEIAIPSNFFSISGEPISTKDVWFLTAFELKELWSSPHISIKIGMIDDRDKTYLNGNLIGETGTFGAERPQAYDKIRIYPVSKDYLQINNTNVLLVHVEKYFENYMGIEQDEVSIGSQQDIQGQLLKTEYLRLAILGLYIAVGSYFLFLFIRRRKELENLYFGMFTILLVIYQIFRNQIKYDFPIDFYYIKKIEYILLPILFPAISHFIREIFKYKWNLYYKIIDTLSLIVSCYFIFGSNIKHFSNIYLYIVQTLWIFYAGASLTTLFREAKKKNLDAILILSGLIALLIAAVIDSLSNWYIIIFPRIFGYVFIFFIFNLAMILANRFVRLNNEIEKWNVELEKKVHERTEALNITLKNVNELKVQQDGDYFLTSLLLNPLLANKSRGKNFNIEFYTSQKKKFEFKNKTHEIGGDISIADMIELENKKYIVFMNGDAMGKSIQGAGGALVLGVVFNAILNRTSFLGKKSKSPEVWLKDAFWELQNVFESFNCSMMASLIIGLIDEESSLLYYINGEHPLMVLYRDEKVEYLEYNSHLFKLGTPYNSNNLLVDTFVFEKGDSIFIGSDGRDDIVISQDETSRQINMDDNLFLQNILRGKGNLLEVVQAIKNSGDLCDDLSLVKITCNIDSKSQIDSDYLLDEESVKEQADSLINHKDFEKAARLLEKWVNNHPIYSSLFLPLSYSLKRLKNYSKAADYGERLFARNPNNLQNIWNLSEIYLYSGLWARTEELLNFGKEKSANNEEIQKTNLLFEKLVRFKNGVTENLLDKDSL